MAWCHGLVGAMSLISRGCRVRPPPPRQDPQPGGLAGRFPTGHGFLGRGWLLGRVVQGRQRQLAQPGGQGHGEDQVVVRPPGPVGSTPASLPRRLAMKS